MRFNVFKNTVLLFVLVLISCGSKSKTQDISKNEMLRQAQPDTVQAIDKTIIVGANQTEKHLPLLNGKRVAIVANQTSVVFKPKGYTHLVDSLLALNIDIKKVFSPEHGFRGNVDAGEHIEDGIDKKTGIPLVSLYGNSKKTDPKDLEDIDILIFDIQDVGVRFYTYISTLHYIMEACAENNIPLIILDRPNPNGNYIDGPTLEKEHQSFLGMHPIPLVHGMTIGEYAKMINGENWLPNGEQANITIIPCANYTHDMTYSLSIRPSPNLPNDQAIKLYPSLGLFEGTNVNAGRGTEFQFQRYGAPFLNPLTMTFTYTPQANFGAKYPKHKDVLCYGEDLSNAKVNDEMTLKWIIKSYQNSIDKSLFFNTNNFTKHAGTATLQKQIESGMTDAEIKATWQNDLEIFKKTRAKYLIYNLH